MSEIKPLDVKEQLKLLREKRGPVPERLNQLRKEQSKIQKAILSSIEKTPKTIPEISKDIDISPDKVLWYIGALRKYNKVEDVKKTGYYMTFIKKAINASDETNT